MFKYVKTWNSWSYLRSQRLITKERLCLTSDVFQKNCTIVYPQQKKNVSTFFFTSYPTLAVISFIHLEQYVQRWNLKIVLIRNSLISKDAEHFFVSWPFFFWAFCLVLFTCNWVVFFLLPSERFWNTFWQKYTLWVE